MANINTSEKVNKKQLGHILGVSYKTARKDYAIIILSLELKRNFLTIADLIKYGILS